MTTAKHDQQDKSSDKSTLERDKQILEETGLSEDNAQSGLRPDLAEKGKDGRGGDGGGVDSSI